MSNYRTEDLAWLAAAFKALSSAQRLRILLKLVACCPPAGRASCAEGMRRCAGELGEDLGLAPSTVSHHLKELRQVGLMRVERQGRRVECWIDRQTLERLESFLRLREGRDGQDCRKAGKRG